MKGLIKGNDTFKDIIQHLKNNYKITISALYLRVVLAEFGIDKRDKVSPDMIDAMVQEMMLSTGNSLGYRSMTIRLRQEYGLNVSRDNVAAA